MAQDNDRDAPDATTVRSGSASTSETYPFVTGTNYTDTEAREYVVTPGAGSGTNPDIDEDATDEVKAARADVEHTRAELSETIDALKEKLSPANLVAEAKEATVGAAHSAVGGAVDSAKEVAHNAVDTAKETAHNVVDSAKEVASNVVGTAKEAAVSAVGAVQGVASNVVSSISGVVDSAKSAVSGVAHDAGHAAKNATHSVKNVSQNVGGTAKGAGATILETIRLNPIPAAITGIGLGWLIMSIRRQNNSTTMYGTSGNSVNRFASATDEYGQNNFATSTYPTSSYSAAGSTGPSAIDAAKEKMSGVKESVTQHAGDIASNVSDKASGLAQTVGNKASDLASNASDLAQNVGTKASDLAQTVGTKASDLAHTVSDKASALGGQAKETAQSAVSATGTYITGNPLAAGAMAVLLGVGVGLLIPATEKENQLLGETRDRLKDQAAEQLHQVADKVTNVAHTAFDSAKQSVKDEAENQGLTGAGTSS